MARTRKPLRRINEGAHWVVRFNHPLTGKTRRVVLAPEAEIKLADDRLRQLNAIFIDPVRWRNPSADTDPAVIAMWTGEKYQDADVDGPHESAAREAPDFTEYGDLRAEIEKPLHAIIAGLRAELHEKDKQIQFWSGKRLDTGPSPALGEALKAWTEKYKGRDDLHTKNVLRDLKRFVDAHGASTRADKFDYQEAKINDWIRGLTNTKKGSAVKGQPLSATRRRTVRLYVIRFLKDAGVVLDAGKISQVGAAQLRAGRGSIRWLERAQAENMVKALAKYSANLVMPPKDKEGKRRKGWPGYAHYWSDVFQLQVATGLRPSELLTLKKADFAPDHSTLTLSPRGKFTLKTGPRTVQVDAKVRPIVARRLENNATILFPRPRGGDWPSENSFYARYNEALTAAAVAASVAFTVDCRIGRRTCASLLLRQGVSYAAVAAMLGDRPDTIKEHYAAIIPSEVSTAGAAL